MKKIILILSIAVLTTSISFSQNPGEIKGRLYDKEKNVSLPGAYIIVKNAFITTGTTSDENGYYTIKPLNAGKYNVIFKYMGYENDTIFNVVVDQGAITRLSDMYLSPEGITFEGQIPEIKDWFIPLIGPEPKKVVDIEHIEKLAGGKKLENLISSITSEIMVTERDELYFRGARNDNFVYIIDGVKAPDGKANIPSGAIGSMAVYTGGVPAMYGDFTGGCIVIETKSFFSRN